MANTTKKVNVNEYRDKIFFDLIDYAHNVKKGETTYHPGFSPNNIRRIVICPDKAVVYYFVTRKNDKNIPLDSEVKQVGYPAVNLMKHTQEEGYEPLISALSHYLVTASIQEIVFCTRACNEPVELTQKEFDLSCLIKSYNNKKGDLMETIKNRYKRLGYISIFNGNFAQLSELVRQKKHKSFFIENPAIKSACSKVIPVNPDTWFDNWGQNAATKDGMSGYMQDNTGSCLNSFFKAVQAKKKAEKEKQEDGFEKYKEEKNKVSSGSEEKFNKTLESYTNFVKCGTLLLSKLQMGANSLYSLDNVNAVFKETAQVTLGATPIYDKMDSKLGITVVKSADTTSKAEDIVARNIELLKVKCQQIYVCLTKMLLSNIINNSQKYGADMFIVALHDFDNVLKPVPELDTLTAQVNRLVQKDIFKGTKVKDAMANVCYLTSVLYLSKRTDKDINDCLSKDYWFDRL